MQRLLIHNQDKDIFRFNFIYIKTSTSLPLFKLPTAILFPVHFGIRFYNHLFGDLIGLQQNYLLPLSKTVTKPNIYQHVSTKDNTVF